MTENNATILDEVLDGRDFEELTAEEQFSVRVNLAMMKAIQDGGNPEELAGIAENTCRELWEYYGVKENSPHENYFEFVIDVGFQVAEIEEWLDEVEAAGFDPSDYSP